jgi:hypothetical protein
MRVGCGLNGSCSGRLKLRDPHCWQANRLLKDGLFKKKAVHCRLQSPCVSSTCVDSGASSLTILFLGLLAMGGRGRGTAVGRRNAPVVVWENFATMIELANLETTLSHLPSQTLTPTPSSY